MFDFTKAAILAHKIKTRSKQLEENPPDSLEEYVALAEEIEGLLASLKGERKDPNFDTAALKAGRADALAGYLASDADLDVLPPIVKPPDPPPAEFPYMTKLTSMPNLADLIAGRDKVYRSAEGFFTVWGGIAAKPSGFFPDFGTEWSTNDVPQP